MKHTLFLLHTSRLWVARPTKTWIAKQVALNAGIAVVIVWIVMRIVK